jgi:predicted dehydrogenase/nucleoside-diphosphate-sugar epimerase
MSPPRSPRPIAARGKAPETASPAASTVRRVAIIGAGYISNTHAEALRQLTNVKIEAVVDPAASAARAFAGRWGVPRVFSTVDELISDGNFDCAHVLVPPPLHEGVGMRLLQAGKAVLIEKPMATSIAGCDALIEASATSGSVLGVNQNQVFHPAFERLLAAVQAKTLGPPRFVSCIYRVPLRQLSAGQFGHWMFDTPVNLLLEQAVHPLSQILTLAGPVETVRAQAGVPMEPRPGKFIYPTIDSVMRCRDLPCQFHFAVGQAFPFWQVTVTCEDGVFVADMIANRLLSYGRTRWLEPLDVAASGTRTAVRLVRESWRNTGRYVLAATGLGRRSDSFFHGMTNSIAAFHKALDAGTAPQIDGAFARDAVDVCHRIAESAIGTTVERLPAVAPIRRSDTRTDVCVIGGTGFIGAHVVRRFLREGMRVSVMARNTRSLPEPFDDRSVTLHRGDIGDPDAVSRTIEGVPVVVNLAHGGGGGSPDEVAARMVGGAEIIARACLAHNTRRLIHVGSIASLYLGPQAQALTGETAPDPRFERRGDYARAKAMTDRLLLGMAADEGLPVCILRPGVVLGDGASPFHSGFGFYNNEQHCIGWNRGNNPLPLVLVEDVAEAVWLASQAGSIARSYNLAGEVRPTAREFIAMLAETQQRPLHLHPQWPMMLWFAELGKWLVKQAAGRRSWPPSLRDILSRGMRAELDCADAKRDLGWQPVADRAAFYRRAISAPGR